VPFLKGALAALDVFISGGKTADPNGPQTVKIMPLAINLTANLQGTISTPNQYHNVRFTNPGSKDAQLDPGGYPYYNEVMGVFNLIKTPEVYWERREENLNDSYNYPWMTCTTPNQPIYGQCQALRVNVDRFQLDTSTFKYVLNPAAGLTIQNMQLQLIIEGEQTGGNYYSNPDNYTYRLMPDDFTFVGKDGKSGEWKFGTPLLDAKNFAKPTFRSFSNVSAYYPSDNNTYWSIWRPKGIVSYDDTTAFLKVVLNLKRNNATANTQNVLYVLTYPVKLKPGSYMQYWSYGYNWRYAALDTTLLLPATPAEVNSFCQSNVYYNTSRYSRTMRDSVLVEEKLKLDGIAVFPNPNTGLFNVKLRRTEGLLLAINIFDISGRKVYSRNEANLLLSSGLTKQVNTILPRGTYILTATTTKGILKTKFIITR
jgi:hypothetical protein